MPLIKCPDCEREISDRAASCIHCGCPTAAVAPTSAIANSSTQILTTKKNSRTCPKCQATQGFRTIGSILGNNVTLINANSVTEGNVFDAVTGRLMEEYQELTATAGTQVSVLVSNIQEVISYWSDRNPDPKKRAEFLDVLTCGACLAVIDKTDCASTLNVIAEQVFIGKSLYGKWDNFFLPVNLPDDALILVVRHTILNVKLVDEPINSNALDNYLVKKLSKFITPDEVPITEEKNVGMNEGPIFYWNESTAQQVENPLPGLNEKAKMRWENNKVIKSVVRRGHEAESRLKVAVQVIRAGERGVKIDLFFKDYKTGLVGEFLRGMEYVSDADQQKNRFTRTFVENLMMALDRYSIERLNKMPEENIKELFASQITR